MLDRTYNVVELLERKVCLVDFAAWLKATTRITNAYFITFFWWVITKKASSSFPGSAASLSSSCPASPWSSSTSSSSPPWGEQSRGDAGWRSTRRSRLEAKDGWTARDFPSLAAVLGRVKIEGRETRTRPPWCSSSSSPSSSLSRFPSQCLAFCI